MIFGTPQAMKKIGVIAMFCCMSTLIWSQTDTNTTDNQGRKQGYWQQFYKNGKLRYTGQFVDDKPRGIFHHYSDMGEHICTITHSHGDTALARYFHLNGKLKAEGKYLEKKRIGIWKFYNEYEEITSQEVYISDRRHGPSRIYYNDGRIARETQFIDDLENGKYTEFFPSGKLKFEATYLDGNPNGEVRYYYPSGRIECIGYYRDAVRDSTWMYYDKTSGTIMRYDFYKNGYKKSSRTPEELQQTRDARNKTGNEPVKE